MATAEIDRYKFYPSFTITIRIAMRGNVKASIHGPTSNPSFPFFQFEQLPTMYAIPTKVKMNPAIIVTARD